MAEGCGEDFFSRAKKQQLLATSPSPSTRWQVPSGRVPEGRGEVPYFVEISTGEPSMIAGEPAATTCCPGARPLRISA